MSNATASQAARRYGPWWTPLAMIAASAAANLVVRQIALMLGPADAAAFMPLSTPFTTIIFSTLGALGAYGVYRLMVRDHEAHARNYLIVAAVVLVVSFAPDLAFPSQMPGWSPFAIGTLMLMHVVAAAVDVALLFELVTRR